MATYLTVKRLLGSTCIQIKTTVKAAIFPCNKETCKKMSDLIVVERESNLTANDLPPGFRLTNYGEASTNEGGKVPKEVFEKWLPETKSSPQNLNWIVHEILEDVAMEESQSRLKHEKDPKDLLDVGCDANNTVKCISVREFNMTVLPQDSMHDESLDIANFLYPIVDDIITMGKIACTALLNKLFVTGSFTCNKMLLILGVSEKWNQLEQDIVEKLLTDGFAKTAEEVNISVKESEIHLNRHCIIGGIISTTLRAPKLFVSPNNSVIGDVIVLTKPLGAPIALDAYRYLQQDDPEMKERLSRVISKDDLQKSYESAIFLMTSLNLKAVQLVEGHEVHALTEINGYSLMEHAQMLAKQQLNEVTFFIYNLPLIVKMSTVAKALGNQVELLQGSISEICGGLLLVMPREQAAAYCRAILNENSRAWIIGVVEQGNRTANMIKKARIIDWTN